MKRYFLYVCLLFLVIGFFGLPKNVSADQITLPKEDAYVLLNIAQKQITDKVLFDYSSSKPEDQSAVSLVRTSVQKNEFKFWLNTLAINISKSCLKVLLFFYATPELENIVDKIDSTLKAEALKQLNNLLVEEEIKTTGGEFEFSYQDCQRNHPKATFCYIIFYKPIDNLHGEISVRFFSTVSIMSPASIGSIGLLTGSSNDVCEKLPPFIVQIKTGVLKEGVSYKHDSDSKTVIEVSFPDEVPNVCSKEKSLLEKVTSFFGKIKGIYNEFSLWINQFFPGARFIANLPGGTNQEGENPEENLEESEDYNFEWPDQEQDKVFQESEFEEEEIEEKEEISGKTEIIWCESNDSPIQNKIIINEIAWMGTVNSGNDEWIELKNISDHSIDLLNWQLFDGKKQIKVIFNESTLLLPNGLYLLERTDDSSVPDINADFIYKGSLSNEDEVLYLYDENCVLQDMAKADPDWPAGNNIGTEKRTMERGSDLNWYTYSGYQNNGLWGTPKEENSFPVKESEKEIIEKVEDQNQSADDDTANVSVNYVPPKILINEIQIKGESASHDFIEIYNPSDETIDMSSWQFKKRSQNGTEDSIRKFPKETFISARSFFLWASSKDENYPSTINADIFSTAYLTENNSIALFDNYQNVIDKLAWGTGLQDPFFEKSPFYQNPKAFQSIERISKSVDNNDNLSDFKIQNCPSPKENVISCYSYVSGGSSGSGGGSIADEENSEEDLEEDKILIAEVQISPISERFIELYNPNNEEIDLSGWYIQRKTETGKSYYSLVSSPNFEGKTIKGLDYFLIAKTTAPFADKADILLDFTLTSGNTILLKNPNRSIIDMLGWGYAQEFEGFAALEPDSNQSIGRKWINDTYQDTDNNFTDFEIQSPSPKDRNQKDIIPPDTIIIPGPPLLTNQNWAKFTFQSNEEDCTFKCKLDNYSWQECFSIYSGLEEGQHVLYAKAIDSFLNEDMSPASYSWTIDNSIESPVMSLFDLHTGSSIYTNNNSVKTVISVSGPEDGIEWYLSEKDEKPFLESSWVDIKPEMFSFATPFQDGLKTVYVWSKDKANNISQLGNKDTIILDTVSPSLDCFNLDLFQLSDKFNVYWNGSDSGSGILDYTVQYAINILDGIWIDWILNDSLTNSEFYGKDGHSYYYRFNTEDRAGNLSGWSNIASTTVDITAPKVSFNNLDSFQRDVSFDLSWEAEDMVTQSIDGVSFTSPSGINGFSLSYSAIPVSEAVTSLKNGIRYWDNKTELWIEWLQGKVLETKESILNLIGENKFEYTYNIIAEDKAGNASSQISTSTIIWLLPNSPQIIEPEQSKRFNFSDDVNSATGTQILIKGISDSLNFIFLEESLSQDQADSLGNWEIMTTLKDGENNLVFSARDELGYESSTTSLNVFLEVPVIEILPSSFDFESKEEMENPDGQVLAIKNIGKQNLDWHIEELSESWLSATPSSGIIFASSSENIAISVDISKLDAGEYDTTFNVVNTLNTWDSKQVLVSLVVEPFTLIDQETTLAPGYFGNLTVRGVEIIMEPGEYTFMDLVLEDGATLVLKSNIDSLFEGFRGVNILAENIDICDDCSISADAKGYPAGLGIGQGGPGSGGILWHGGGAGYGGQGGIGYDGQGGICYGSLTQPIDLGSGPNGGSARGGGAIKINVSDKLTLDGMISSNGSDGQNTGGGSGGSVYIITNEFTGIGSISADGGGDANIGGAGGGGRIAVYFNSSDFPSENIQVFGTTTKYGSSGAGTIFLKSVDQEYGDLIVKGNDISGTTYLYGENNTFNELEISDSSLLYFSGILSAQDIRIINNAIMESLSTSTITAGKNIVLDLNAQLIAPSEKFLTISAEDILIQRQSIIKANIIANIDNLIIENGSLISADTKGYSAGKGIGQGGPGSGGSLWHGGGAGYGGQGGIGYDGQGGICYGFPDNPVDFGSGPNGGSAIGGGAIKIDVNNKLTLDGIISSNGSNGQNTGAGSGGSVYITTNEFTGIGSISADGGGDNVGGAGGGGRIAVYYDSDEFNGTLQSNGGSAFYGLGENGSIVLLKD